MSEPTIIGAAKTPELDHAERIICPGCGADRRVVGHGYRMEPVTLPFGLIVQCVIFCAAENCRVQLAVQIMDFKPAIEPGSRFKI